jgi:carbamoyltransferase
VGIVLGINNGHHASCAIVKDGQLVSGIEQERITRIKGDGSNYLSNNLPVKKCLETLDLSFDDVDLIVSSFQAIGPGGVGLMQPLFEYGFDLFDPFDKRHFVISHHLGHALSAFGTSGFNRSAVLICDLAGSTTKDGKDFAIPFSTFYNTTTNFKERAVTKTECLSIYSVDKFDLDLKYREFCVPHCSPEIFVSSPASLYDNIARFVFNKENAHGQLMALATLGKNLENTDPVLGISDLIQITSDKVHFTNNWQHKVSIKHNVRDYAHLAAIVQQAFQISLLEYVKKAKHLTGEVNLTAAGGAFLNILANSNIHSSKTFKRYHVPSAPHDAGVAIGCAYYGWNFLGDQRRLQSKIFEKKAKDRIGSTYSEKFVLDELIKRHKVCKWLKTTPNHVASLIAKNMIVGRFSGAAEFGPRALGGRSLLANPIHAESKNLLNRIKGREPWRPVAPIVIKGKLNKYFDGPHDSPYMNMAHTVKGKYRGLLKALFHPDHSARVQTLEKNDDPFLYEILTFLELLNEVPIIVNTSLNGPDVPIVETPRQAIDFFLKNDLIDCLLLEDYLVTRNEDPPWHETRVANDVYISSIYFNGNEKAILTKDGGSRPISKEVLKILKTLPTSNRPNLNPEDSHEMKMLMYLDFLVPS